MALCCDISVLAIIGLILMVAGLASFLGGFGSRGWMILESTDGDTEISVGLWTVKNCTNSSTCLEAAWHDDLQNDAFTAIKYVECLILVLFVGATIFHIIYVIYKSRCLALTITTCNLVIVLSLISTVVCWMVNIPSGFYPSYSLGMVVLSAVFVSISSSIIIRDLKTENYYVNRVSITPVTSMAETSFSNTGTSARSTRMRSEPKRKELSQTNDSDRTLSQASTSVQSLVISEDHKTHLRTQRQYRTVNPIFQISTPRKYGSASYLDDF